MTDREVLQAYLPALRELNAVEQAVRRAEEELGLPAMHMPRLQLSGRGTNMPETAALQHYEYLLEARQRSAKRVEALRSRMDALLEHCGPRTRTILWCYYGLGETDEETAAHLFLTRSRVCQLRNHALRLLDAAEPHQTPA